jgi:hypothetical protein
MGYNMPLVELQHFLNDLVHYLPHLGHASNALTQANNPRGYRLTEKRPIDNPNVEGSKRYRRGDGSGRG